MSGFLQETDRFQNLDRSSWRKVASEEAGVQLNSVHLCFSFVIGPFNDDAGVHVMGSKFDLKCCLLQE